MKSEKFKLLTILKQNINLYVLYSLLFALSLILINPWGSYPGEIWTKPKLLAICLTTILNILVALRYWSIGSLIISNRWKVSGCLWLIFLGVGVVSTYLSPSPWRSLWGQSSLGDGLIYWMLLAAFVLSNALVIQLNPILVRSQLYGLLAGGFLVALSIFPQLINWRIDYTATSGQVIQSHQNVLKSLVWQNHMPIGLYSHRGYAAFVLSAVGLLGLLGVKWGWMKLLWAVFLQIFVCLALFYIQIRGAQIAFLVSTVYLIWRFFLNVKRLRLLGSYLIGGLFFIYCLLLIGSIFSKTSVAFHSLEKQQLFYFPTLERVSSGRIHLWKVSLKAIAERPFIGWGFDGFGTAFPFVADWTEHHKSYLPSQVAVAQIVRINDSTFDYLGIDGKVYSGMLINNKAHNILLDTTLSTGGLGFLSYTILIAFSLWSLRKTYFSSIGIVTISYLIYAFTWFESAQISHIAWWSLSIGLNYPEEVRSIRRKNYTIFLTKDNNSDVLKLLELTVE
jgi:O-antigen ligase